MNNNSETRSNDRVYTENTTAKQAKREYHFEMRKKRRKKRFAGYLGFIFLFVAVFCLAAFFLIFRVKTINFSGNNLYTDSQLTSGAGFSFLSNYFFVSEKKIVDNLGKNYPVLEKVTVEKQFPSTVNITVTESTPEFFVTIGNFTYILDNRLVVHRSAENISEAEALDLVQLSLPNVSSCIAGQYVETDDKDIIKMFSTLYENLVKYELISEVSSIDISDKFDIRFTLGSEYTIKIGNILECENKIAYVKRFLSEIYNLDIHVIDVTDENVQKIIVSKG